MHRYYKVISATFLFIQVLLSTKAQDSFKGSNIYLSPRITIGYTISSGFNYGFDLVTGLYQHNEMNFGLDFSYYMVNTNQGHHAIKGFAFVAESEYMNAKIGAGMVSRRWGLKNVNKTRAPGIMVDVSAGFGIDQAPWIGAKGFIFKRSVWSFYDQPSYISAYTYFKTPEIVIFKKEPDTPGI